VYVYMYVCMYLCVFMCVLVPVRRGQWEAISVIDASVSVATSIEGVKVGIWVYGYMGIWVYGYMGIEVRGGGGGCDKSHGCVYVFMCLCVHVCMCLPVRNRRSNLLHPWATYRRVGSGNMS
jgi:hypothetical protein